MQEGTGESERGYCPENMVSFTPCGAKIVYPFQWEAGGYVATDVKQYNGWCENESSGDC